MLKEKLVKAMKDAMRAREAFRLGVIRMALSEIQRIEVDERAEVDDLRCLAIMDKMVKQRRDAARQFIAGKRQDLADREFAEIEILKNFLPEPVSPDEIDILIDDAIEAIGATSSKDMGQVMGHLKSTIQGRADMQEVSKIVKLRLH